jgi:hypothetical protein
MLLTFWGLQLTFDLLNDYWFSFPLVKRPGQENYHSPLPTAKFNKEWNYTSTPLHFLRAWTEKTLPFLQFTPHNKYYKSVTNTNQLILDFKLSPCFECCIISFWWFPGAWILCADVSEHSICSIFVGVVSRIFLLTPPTKMEPTECT